MGNQLKLERCPHCNVDKPNLKNVMEAATVDYLGENKKYWRGYQCTGCGSVTTAYANMWNEDVITFFPTHLNVDDAIPARAKEYLKQSIESKSSPAGSIMLSASSVDAMLKEIGYKDGSLYDRIKKAAEEHHLTKGMEEWAHDVRLDANDQRHDDEEAELPSTEDAQRCIDFTVALGEYLFVLPEKVRRGKEAVSHDSESNTE